MNSAEWSLLHLRKERDLTFDKGFKRVVMLVYVGPWYTC